MKKFLSFPEWYELYLERKPLPIVLEVKEHPKKLKFSLLFIFLAVSVAGAVHTVPALQATIPFTESIGFFLALSGYIGFDLGLFLATYIYTMYKSKLSLIGIILTLIYSVIANLYGAQMALEDHRGINEILILGMGIIPLWSIVVGHQFAEIVRSDSQISEDRAREQDKIEREHKAKASAIYSREVKAWKRKPDYTSSYIAGNKEENSEVILGNNQTILPNTTEDKKILDGQLSNIHLYQKGNLVSFGELHKQASILSNAKSRGKLLRDIFEENRDNLLELVNNGLTQANISKVFMVSQSSVSNILRK